MPALEARGRRVLEDIVSQSALRGLEIPRIELRRSKLPEQLRFNLEQAQSELFGGVLNDPNVRAIGFDDSEDFPISRNQFAERAVKPRQPREEEDEDQRWEVSVRRLRVNSPNFDKEHQSKRRWLAGDTAGNPFLFEIWDEGFWTEIWTESRGGNLQFSETTELEVQMATLRVDGRVKEHRVVRVLAIDGRKLSNELDDVALSAILGEFMIEDTTYDLDLFNGRL